MEISYKTKAELIKPVFLAVGLPLAFSLASLILEKIRVKKSACLEASLPDIRVDALESNFPERDVQEVSGDGVVVSLEDECILATTQLRNLGEEEILGLLNNIKDLRERELVLEARFLRYHEMKEEEFALMEFENNLLLELVRVEFMDREVSSMEAENQRFEEMVKDILKALEEIESSKLENVMLQHKVKKLLKRLIGRTRVISDQNLRIEAMEAVTSDKDTELVRKSDAIKELEDEIEEQRMAIQSLQEEKNNLLKKLQGFAESSGLKKGGSEKETMKDYDQVVTVLEQLQKDRAAEVKELVYLRWCNACLRHELFRRNQEQEAGKPEGKKIDPAAFEFEAGGEMKGFGFENGSSSSTVTHDDPSISLNRGSHGHPKKRKLYEKFKKWVEGGEKVTKTKSEEKKKPELKFFGSHSVAHFGDATHVPARNSSTSS